jgi:ribosomal protein S18 acetylase RimI-like enzyme
VHTRRLSYYLEIVNKGITLREVQAEDEDFLLRLYASTRSEVAIFGWDAAAQQAFIKMQFDMQTRSYAMQFPAATHSIVLIDCERAGRILVDRGGERISLIDIAINPEHRGNGIGTAVIQQLQDQAANAALPLDLTVDKGNTRAFDLYRKLGFTATGENDLSIWMRWTR